MGAIVVGILAAGVLALATSVVLFLAFRFERFVGVRYLERAHTSRVTRVALLISASLTVAALGAFAAGRGWVREVETVAVIVALLAALATMVFALLRIFSVFTTVSTIGVVLGVASLVVVLAVTSGFEREFQEKVLAVNAHLIVTAYGIEQDIDEAEREADMFRKKLAGLPGLVRTTKFSFSAGEVMIGRVGANLKGIDLVDGLPEVQRVLTAGSAEALGQPAHCPGPDGIGDGGHELAGRMILGSDLARRARTKLGQCVSVLVPFAGGKLDGPPVAVRFRVVGIFEMGFHEYDARLALIPLEDARRLANARQSVFGLELRFADRDQALRAQEEVERRLGPEPRIIDWKTLNHNLFTALAMQKLIIALILGVIILVAAFNIVASLTLIVLSKVREIAILSSMGARAASLVRVFVVAGSFVGFVGTGLGILYGLLVCGLAQLYGYSLDPKVYLIGRLPVEISGQELLLVAGATQLICFLFTLYPAARAARLRVVEGLRYT